MSLSPVQGGLLLWAGHLLCPSPASTALLPSICGDVPNDGFCLQEQRLKFLKQQDQRQQQEVAEQEKLKKLKEMAEKQEAKLKKVRALKGHVEQKRLSNGRLGESLGNGSGGALPALRAPLQGAVRCSQPSVLSAGRMALCACNVQIEVFQNTVLRSFDTFGSWELSFIAGCFRQVFSVTFGKNILVGLFFFSSF